MTGWNFDNSYARLPQSFFSRVAPVSVAAPKMVVFNDALARTLNVDVFTQPDIFAGNFLPAGAEPIAQAYAGHQYGHFTLLGDGRAVLLGEHVTAQGARFDVQLKGSGPTPYARRGDGRAALGPMLREYIISEAMHNMGIPTTRSLAVVTTGEPVTRQVPLTGAVLTRIASSHIRVGTFEYAAARLGEEGVRSLADYAIDRHYPELTIAENKYLAFLQAVIARQAALVAQWLCIGFVHGVMNTDNMTISGETIDYGPCAFIDAYDPEKVFSSIDTYSRYAYARQPDIAQWNLARFAESLLPLLATDQAQAIDLAEEAIVSFRVFFKQHWMSGMRRKLGLVTEEAGDEGLINGLLSWMKATSADFTVTFRELAALPKGDAAWNEQWRARVSRQSGGIETARKVILAANPEVIPRNHRVEEALAAAENGDIAPFHYLVQALADPYETKPDRAAYLAPPPEVDAAYRTFCGT